MAIKGVSKPICADYTHDGNGVVKYNNAYSAGEATEYGIEVETSEDNNLYADNKVKESASGTFSKGTLSLSTADLEPEMAVKILGLKAVKRTIDGTEVDEVVYDDEMSPPELGFGIIEEHQIDGVTKYLPIILARVKFKNPGFAATTRGEEIDWQTKELEAEIMRSDQSDDNYNHPWMFTPKIMYVTESDAKAYIMSVFGGEKQSAQV